MENRKNKKTTQEPKPQGDAILSQILHETNRGGKNREKIAENHFKHSTLMGKVFHNTFSLLVRMASTLKNIEANTAKINPDKMELHVDNKEVEKKLEDLTKKVEEPLEITAELIIE